jgi:hypothetical protein
LGEALMLETLARALFQRPSARERNELEEYRALKVSYGYLRTLAGELFTRAIEIDEMRDFFGLSEPAVEELSHIIRQLKNLNEQLELITAQFESGKKPVIRQQLHMHCSLASDIARQLKNLAIANDERIDPDIVYKAPGKIIASAQETYYGNMPH